MSKQIINLISAFYKISVIKDKQNNMNSEIYISAYLSEVKSSNGNLFGNKVYDFLSTHSSIIVKEIKAHQKNIWCRDYMPVKTAQGNFAQFIYAPSYLTETEEGSKKCPKLYEISREVNQEGRMAHALMDAGMLEVFGNTAIISDRVFEDNLRSKEQLQKAFQYMDWNEDEKEMMMAVLPKDQDAIINLLKDALQVNQLFSFPPFPFDVTGHIGNMIRFVSEDTVLINELKDEEGVLKYYSQNMDSERKGILEKWYSDFTDVLLKSGLNSIEMPFTGYKNEAGNSLEGIYLNFLKLEDLIIMPGFNQSEDLIAKEKLEKAHNRPVEIVDVTELAKEGGALNRIAWVF